MKFTPIDERIEFEPVKREDSWDDKYYDMGKIIDAGTVEGLVAGDYVLFDSYGVFESPEVDGVKQYFLRGREYIIAIHHGEQPTEK